VNELVPRRFQALVLGALVAGAVILAFGNLDVDEGEQGSAVALAITLIVMLTVTVLLWRFLVQPSLAGRRAAARDGLILAVVAILTAVVYWTGLAFALAPAAIALGTISREGRASRARAESGPDPAAGLVPADKKTGTAAMALGWIALGGAIVVGFIDAIAS
jgi:multisubunit Na+/H+ antiporter MnhF subunit